MARIGCHADGETYVVPVVYAWDGECAWMLSAPGRKVEMLRRSPEACLEVDEYERGRWCSVILWGRYEELEGADAERAVELLAARFGASSGGREPADGPTAVAFRIRRVRATGRRTDR